MRDKLRLMWVQLTGDKRRFSILCVTLLVGLLLWARLIVVSNLPRTAVADPIAASARTDNRSPSTDVVRPNNRRTAHLALAPDRDPFVISPVYFPKLKRDGELVIEPTKSPLDLVEEEQAKELRWSQHLTAVAQTLKLEAVMTGRSMALISGRVYRLGEPVTALADPSVSFTLSVVELRSVTLSCEGRSFELKISTPGE